MAMDPQSGPSPKAREAGWLLALLVLSLLLRLALSPLPGYKVDQGTFLYWHSYVMEQGIAGFYQPPNWSDYPPLNPYLFWLSAQAITPLGAVLPPVLPWEAETVARAALKVPANLFDLGIAAFIFFWWRRRNSFRSSLVATAAYAFNPATIFDLAIWGQVDSVYSFFMVGSLLLFLRNKYELSAASLALAVLTKPQSAVLLPVLAYFMLRERRWRRIMSSVLVAAFTVFLVSFPFAGFNPVGFLYNLYRQAYSVYPYTSVNAYNLWGALQGFWLPDSWGFLGLSFQLWGNLAYLAFLALVLWLLHRRPHPQGAIFAAFLLAFGLFILTTRMHERYLFSALPLLALVLYLPRAPLIYAGLSLTFFGTLAYLLPLLNANRSVPGGDFSFYLFIPAYLLLLGFSLYSFFKMSTERAQG